MKYLNLLFFSFFLLFANISFSNDRGIVDSFSQMSVAEQDQKIQKNFEELHKMMAELESIISRIERTKEKIRDIKIALKADDLCLALPLLEADINQMERKLSEISEDTDEYKKIQMEYINYKKVYDAEVKSVVCK